MAQVYVLRGMETGKVKLGVTNNFSGRLPAYKTHCAEPLEVVLVYQSNYGLDVLKKEFESKFKHRWGHLLTHGEWYLKSDEMLIAVLKWVLSNEAYRIAVKQAFQNRPGLLDQLAAMTDQEVEEWLDADEEQGRQAQRALEAEAAAPVVVPKSLEALKEMFGLKPASEVK